MVEVGRAARRGPDHVNGRAGPHGANLFGEASDIIEQRPPALIQRRGPLLQHDVVPGPLPDGLLRLSVAPLVLQARAGKEHALPVQSGLAAGLRQRFDDRGQVVISGEAVADEEDADRVGRAGRGWQRESENQRGGDPR